MYVKRKSFRNVEEAVQPEPHLWPYRLNVFWERIQH